MRARRGRPDILESDSGVSSLIALKTGGLTPHLDARVLGRDLVLPLPG